MNKENNLIHVLWIKWEKQLMQDSITLFKTSSWTTYNWRNNTELKEYNSLVFTQKFIVCSWF